SAPLTRGAGKPASKAPAKPAPAVVAAPKPAPPPKPAPAPKPEKPKKAHAQKPAPAPSLSLSLQAPPPASPPPATLRGWEQVKATRFDAEESIESAMGEVPAADTRLRFAPLATILAPPDVADKALVDADKALADAKQAYNEMELDKAKGLLETAL